MTRVNVGVDPREISKKALNAEHREIVRIPNMLRAGKFKNISKAPAEFTLGEGHVLFLASRIGYLKRRYQAIYDACIEKNINVQSFITAFEDIPEEYMNDYTPTESDREKIITRMNENGYDIESVPFGERDKSL
jgi:hypothetical protein